MFLLIIMILSYISEIFFYLWEHNLYYRNGSGNEFTERASQKLSGSTAIQKNLLRQEKIWKTGIKFDFNKFAV